MESAETTMKSTYLGDGLYAEWDGYSIILKAPRGHDVDVVYLEPAVYQKLLDFAKEKFGG